MCVCIYPQAFYIYNLIMNNQCSRMVWEQGSIPERSHSHTFVSFHMPGLLGDTSSTERESLCYKSKQSESQSQSPSHWRWVSALSQAATVVAHIWRSGNPAGLWGWPVVQLSSSVGWSELWVLTHQGGDPPLLKVSEWSPYPGIQTCGFGHSRPLLKTLPLHPITSVLT